MLNLINNKYLTYNNKMKGEPSLNVLDFPMHKFIKHTHCLHTDTHISCI